MQETNAVYFERPLIVSVKPEPKAYGDYCVQQWKSVPQGVEL